MKHYIFYFTALLALLTSCKNDHDAARLSYGDQLVFTASILNTRTTISEGSKLAWQDGDLVSVNGTLYKAVADDDNPSVASLIKAEPADPDPEPVDGKYIAIYPAVLASGEDMVLPSTQTYNGSCNLSGINPMYAESRSTDLGFCNLCGLFEFNIKGDDKIASIEVCDQEAGMSGKFNVSDHTAMLTEDASVAAEGVTLDCGEGGISLSDNHLFYVAVPAGEYSHISITVTAINGKEQVLTLKQGAKAVIRRNTVYPVSFDASFSAPAPLNGKFSVGEGMTVRFAKGNLFWDGASWYVERTQYAAAAEWDPSHVSSFYWTDKAYGASTAYSPSGSAMVDWGVAYCADNGIKDDAWRTLSSDEWNYMLNLRQVPEGQQRFTNTVGAPVTIGGVLCKGLFIYPDGYEGKAVDSSFTWKSINKAGIVYLPAAGCRDRDKLSVSGEYGYYWAKDSINPMLAYNVRFGTNSVEAYNAFGRYMGYSVRLVTDKE